MSSGGMPPPVYTAEETRQGRPPPYTPPGEGLVPASPEAKTFIINRFRRVVGNDDAARGISQIVVGYETRASQALAEWVSSKGSEAEVHYKRVYLIALGVYVFASSEANTFL